MNQQEFESLLAEFDEALVKAFPGPEPLSALVVGGACLLFQGIITRATQDIDVIIFEMLGSQESTLIYHAPVADKIRKIIQAIGRRHGLKRQEQMFFNDDCAPFLLELGQLPPMRLLKAYQKLHLYIPDNMRYILACKLMAGRPGKDFEDIMTLCKQLQIQNRAQAQAVVDHYFPSPVHQGIHELFRTLDALFGKEP